MNNGPKLISIDRPLLNRSTNSVERRSLTKLEEKPKPANPDQKEPKTGNNAVVNQDIILPKRVAKAAVEYKIPNTLRKFNRSNNRSKRSNGDSDVIPSIKSKSSIKKLPKLANLSGENSNSYQEFSTNVSNLKKEPKRILDFETGKNEIYINEYYDYNEQNMTPDESPLVGGTEMNTGIPAPEKYNQYIINKYSFPKSFICGQKVKSEHSKKDDTKILVNPPHKRKGVMGWKLSKGNPIGKQIKQKSKQFKRRSNSNNSQSKMSVAQYMSEASKVYNSGAKDNAYLKYNKEYIERNKTVEYDDSPDILLNNDRIYQMSRGNNGVPVESRNIELPIPRRGNKGINLGIASKFPTMYNDSHHRSYDSKDYSKKVTKRKRIVRRRNMHEKLESLIESPNKLIPEVVNGRLVYAQELSHQPSDTFSKNSELREKNKNEPLQSIYNSHILEHKDLKGPNVVVSLKEPTLVTQANPIFNSSVLLGEIE